MRRCNLDCEFLSEFDLFGKEPGLYFERKPLRTSLFGKVLTYTYILLYIAFFIYKIVRMIQKVDITFYETYAYSGFPSIQLSPDNFYGGFALGGMIEETIYYPKAFYYKGHRVEGIMNWETIELELEVCKLEKFGSKYQDMFKDKDLNNLYCLKDIGDVTLEGYSTLESYSYFYVAFFPCVGQTKDGRPCQPDAVIDNFFQLNALEFKMQDIELTPQIYDSPSEPKEKDIASPIYRLLYQQIYAYLQIVILETDQDVVGFEGLSNIKTEKFLKYEESWIIAAPSPHYYAFDPTKPICDVTVQLSAKVLTQKRKNTKLIEVLGDVGGLMEVVWSAFNMMAAVICDILYDKALVNNLFSFDLDRKTVMIKNKKPFNLNISNDEPKIYSPINPVTNYPQNTVNNNGDKIVLSKSKLNEEVLKKKGTDETVLVKRPKKKKKKIGNKTKPSIISSETKLKTNDIKNYNIEYDNNDIYNKRINVNNRDFRDNRIFSEEKIRNSEIDKSNEKKIRIIDGIKLNRLCIFFCFCFVRKKKNIQNILLDEGMDLITEKLDIINIFNVIHKYELIQENASNRENIFEMSANCRQKLKALSKSIYNSLYIT